MKKSPKMKPKKRHKKRIKKVLLCVIAAVMILPTFSSLLSQKKTVQVEPVLEQAYMDAMESMSVEPNEPEIDGTYEVVNVLSDKSLLILQDGVERSVNLIGIENAGVENEGHLERLLSDNYVDLEFDTHKEDENGNLQAYVYLENGQFLNEELLRNGFAKLREEPENTKHEAVLKDAQELAQKNAVGIWTATEEN